MKKAHSPRRRPWIPALLLGAVLVLVLLSSVRVRQFAGSSMAPTIQDGDIVLFQTWGYTPRQGDVVLLEKPGFPSPSSQPAAVIKRIAAVGGQHVRVDYEAGVVLVDGTALEEPYLPEPMVDRYDPSMSVLDVTVPQGAVYVLGDNRNHSADSRHAALGCVPTECLLGKAFYILSP